MSSALSRAKVVSFVGCPMRMAYGRTEQRRSRNVAAAGMFGVISLTMLCAVTLLAEKTLMLPPVQAVRTTLVHAQFRTVQMPKHRPTQMKKVLAEESEFFVPEVPRKEVKPKPVPDRKPKPVPDRKPEPAPEVKPKPEKNAVSAVKPRVKSKTPPVPKLEKAAESSSVQKVPDTAKDAGASSVQNAAASPGAAGSVKAEADSRSEALAAILRAVEKYKQYPRQGRRSGAEGTCVLRVQVGGDGRVASCSLSEGSGRSVLDAAARRLGEKLVGLTVGTKGGFNVLVPVHYRLTDA